jgi:general nucleoside transport system ATP-binding protein
MDALVTLTGITKKFGTLLANDGVNLTIRKGEIHALLGENGAGKSTLVKILYGLLAPDAGEIAIEGKVVTLPSPQAARAAGIGMVFQHFSLFEELTALENIAIPLEGAMANATLRAEVSAKATHFGLAIALDRPVYTLSAGERQRIEILRALMQAPKLLILDEPTSVLTPQEAEGLFKTLDLLAQEGVGVLFISHKLDEVRRLCSGATILRGGRRVASADPREMSAAALAALMVGEGVAHIRDRDGEAVQGTAILTCEGVSAKPDSIHGVSLKSISLTVKAGEIVAIAGIAGNGQAELFAALSGEAAITSGRITLLGQDVAGQDINTRRKAGAAFVPEARLGHATLPQTTLSDNLILSWHATEEIGGFFPDRAVLAKRVSGIITEYDVRAASPDPRAAQLSGGNLQKYTVGREMTRNPRFLLVDQPTWGVDARAAAMIRQTLLNRAREGAAILIITQDLDEAFQLADRIAVMREGELLPPIPVRETTREAIGLQMTNRPVENEAA